MAFIHNVHQWSVDDPLSMACEMGNIEAVKFLLQHSVARTDQSCWPAALIAAAKSGCSMCVQAMIDHGTEINSSVIGTTALSVACNNDNFAIVAQLLEHGADIADWTASKQLVKILSAKICDDDNNKDAIAVLEKIVASCGRDILFDSEVDETMLCRRLLATKHFDLAKLIVYRSPTKQTDALYYAACNNWPELLSVLIDSGVGVNSYDTSKRTALIGACEGGHTDIVQWLLDNGAKPFHDEVVRFSDRAPYSFEPVVIAAANNNTEIISLLMSQSINGNSRDTNVTRHVPITVTGPTSALSVAVIRGHVRNVELLLDAGADVLFTTRFNVAPIHNAASCGYSNVMRLLLANQADVKARTCVDGFCTPLFLALAGAAGLKMSSCWVCQYMIPGPSYLKYDKLHTSSCVAGNTKNGSCCKHTAIGYKPYEPRVNYLSVISLLLQYGADPNDTNFCGETPLYIACLLGGDACREIVETLLNFGADPNFTPKCGNQLQCTFHPLLAACQRSNTDVVRLLLERGVDPNLKNWNSSEHYNVPLFISVLHGNVDTMKCLIDAGADVSRRDEGGKTALHFATGDMTRNDCKLCRCQLSEVTEMDKIRQRMDIVKLLVARGADINAVNCMGETALHGAARSLTRHNLCIYIKALEDEEYQRTKTWMDFTRLHRFVLPTITAFIKTQIDIIRFLLSNGSILDDGHCPSVNYLCFTFDMNCTSLPSPCDFMNCSPIDFILIKLLIKAGATLKWIKRFINLHQTSASVLSTDLTQSTTLTTCSMLPRVTQVSRIVTTADVLRTDLCKAVALSGVLHSTTMTAKPVAQNSEGNQVAGKTAAVGGRYICEACQAFRTWVACDGCRLPSLMQQCRIAIRRHLFAVNGCQSIVDAVKDIPLPEELSSYIIFEGPLTEVNLVTTDTISHSDLITFLRLQSSWCA